MGDVPNYAIDERLDLEEMHELEKEKIRFEDFRFYHGRIKKYKSQLEKEQTLNKKLINISEEIIEEFIENDGVVTADKISKLRDIILNSKEVNDEYKKL